MRADPKKKKRKENSHNQNVTLIKLTNELNLAITLRTLKSIFGFGNKRLATFLESYMVLMEEVQDRRLTVSQAVKEAEEIAGINIKELLERL